MNLNDLMNRILFLIPDAKFSVWDCDKDKYMGEGNPIEIDSFLISWNKANEQQCPSIDEIVAVNQGDIDAHLETMRKECRDAEKANDLTMIACYEIEKKSNPDISFSGYLDYLESKQSA